MKNMLLNITFLKVVLSLILASVLNFILPIKYFLIGTLILVTIDTCTGIWKAKTKHEPITSKGLRRTISKLIGYFLAICLAHLFKIIWMNDIDVAYYVSSYIALTELKSNLENIGEITGVDIWTAIKDYVEKKKSEQP